MRAISFGLPSAATAAARTQMAAAKSMLPPATASLSLPSSTVTPRIAPRRMLPAQLRRTSPLKPIGRRASPLLPPPASRDAPGAAAAADADAPAAERYLSFLPTVALANDGPNAAFDVADAETAAGPTASPATESTESDSDALAVASMGAFAKMEAQMRARRREAEAAAMPAVPAAPTAASVAPASSSWHVELSLSGDHLHRPREPGPGECCGRDCANCVWIQYAQALAEYDEKVDAFKQREMLSAPPASESKPVAAVADAPNRELTRFEPAMAKERAAATKDRANSLPPSSEG